MYIKEHLTDTPTTINLSKLYIHKIIYSQQNIRDLQ